MKPIMHLGESVFSIISSKTDFNKFMNSMNFQGDTLIIKPNWVDAKPGSFTEAKVLELFFEYFSDKKIVVVESHTAWRNPEYSEKGLKPLL